jgi:hypothetical protein
MSYELRNKKKKSSRSTILCIILGIAYLVFGIAIVCIWLFYNRTIKDAQDAFLETDESEELVIKDGLDTVSKIGGNAIHEFTESMIKAARPEEESKTEASSFVKDPLDSVSEFGGKKIGELVDHMVKSARPDEEEKAREEAEAAARRARERKLSELKQRKKQLDSKIAAADSRHRTATRTVPMTPVFETTDSDSTRRISAQQKALKEKLRSDADNAGQELRKLQIERQHIIHEISKLEK